MNEWNGLDNAAIKNLISPYRIEQFMNYKQQLKDDGHTWDEAEEILTGYIWDEIEEIEWITNAE